MALARRAGELLAEKKGENLVLLDVRGVTSVADFFLVVSGNSGPHLKALAESVDLGLKKEGSPAFRQSGDPQSGWIVLDFIDLVVHVFTPATRSYYDLERLWKDAPRLEISAA